MYIVPTIAYLKNTLFYELVDFISIYGLYVHTHTHTYI